MKFRSYYRIADWGDNELEKLTHSNHTRARKSIKYAVLDGIDWNEARNTRNVVRTWKLTKVSALT